MLLYLSAAATLAQAAPEPAPAGWERGAAFVVQHAESRPDIAFPLIAVCAVLVLVGAAGYALTKYAIPAWRAEKQADREHLSSLVNRRGAEAQEDLAAFRALAGEQHKNITERIGEQVSRQTGEIAKLVDRSEKHTDLLQRVAQKVGVGLLLLVLLSLAVREGARYVATIGDAPIRCSPPCNVGQRCTASGCREIKTGTATASKPTSSLRMVSFATLAGGSCSERVMFCP